MEDKKVQPGFQTEWSTPEERKKDIVYSKIVISPPIYLHPLTITYISDANGIQTQVAYKLVMSREIKNLFGSSSVIDIPTARKHLEELCFPYDIHVSKLNPFLIETKPQRPNLVLVHKVERLLGVDELRQLQIRCKGIKDTFYKYCKDFKSSKR